MEYSEKLKHPKWQKKRLEILQRDNFTCVLCGDTETELQVNHLKYTGEPYEAPNEDLETLCKHCHALKHFMVEVKILKIKKFEKKIGFYYVINTEDTTAFLKYEDKINQVVLIGECGFGFNSDVLKTLFEFNNNNNGGR